MLKTIRAWLVLSLFSLAAYATTASPGTIVVLAAGSTGSAISTDDGVSWSAITLPSAAQWAGVAWNGTTFCATSGSFSNAFATSTDGVNWSAQNAPSSSFWSAVAWDGVKFVVINAGNSNVITSATCLTGSWTSYPAVLPAGSTWDHLVWNGTSLAALDTGTNGTTVVSLSTDHGATWSALKTLSSSHIWYGISDGVGEPRFVAVSDTSTATSYSTTGASWSAGTISANGYRANPAWNGSKYVAVGGSYSNTSTDGITWGSDNLINGSMCGGVKVLTWNGHVFVTSPSTGCSDVYYSTDGVSWTKKAYPYSRTWIAMASVPYPPAAGGGYINNLNKMMKK